MRRFHEYLGMDVGQLREAAAFVMRRIRGKEKEERLAFINSELARYVP